MASLQDTVRKNGKLLRGQGGTLSEEAPDTIQQLSGQAGMQAPPLTPLGASALGANDDQQKMMGSPTQKQSALQLATQPVEESLQGKLRRQQARSQATSQEQATIQKSQDMQNLGQLGDRVNDFVNAQRQKLVSAAPVAVQAGSGQVNGRDLSGVKPLLEQLRANPDNREVMLQLNQALGYDINNQLSPDQINELYESSVESISRGGAGNIDNDLTVQDLTNVPGFTYTPDQLAGLLGLPADQINGMSVGQLRAAIQAEADREFSQSANMDQRAQSGQLGQAERGLARAAGREASATGVRSSEADVAHLEEQIANADRVSFGGREMNVDELLSDENISNTISDYMNSAPDSELRKQLEASEPGLVDFIRKNEALLNDASKQMQGNASEFQSIQQYNKGLQSLSSFGGIKLDDSIAKAILPGYGELQSSRTDIQSVPALKYVNEMGPEVGRAFADQVNAEQSRDPQFAQDLKSLNANQLKEWGIGQGPSSAFEQKYLPAKRLYEDMSRTNSGDADTMARLLVPDVGNAQEAQSKLTANRVNNVLGIPSKLNSTLLDSNGDGIVDSPQSIKDNFNSVNPFPKLSNGPGEMRAYNRQPLGQPAPARNDTEASVVSKLSGAAQKGEVGEQDLNNAQLNLDELVYMDANRNGKVDYTTVSRLQQAARDDNTIKLLGSLGESVTGAQIPQPNPPLTSVAEANNNAQNNINNNTFKARDPYQKDISTNYQDLIGKLEKALKEQGDQKLNRKAVEDMIQYYRDFEKKVSSEMNDQVGNVLGKGVNDLNPVNYISKGINTGATAVVNAFKPSGGGGGGNPIANAITGGDGCFLSGTMFAMWHPDGYYNSPIETIQPGEYMDQGGRVIATAQFVVPRIYDYKGILVSGTHAVLEDGTWMRVQDSIHAEYLPEYNNSKVYVVWNENHRMISTSGIVFADYAETDSTAVEIERQRNIDELNRLEQSPRRE